jgi:MFS family permease
MFVGLCANTFAMWNMDLLITSQLPAFVEKHHPDLSAFSIGFLMAAFPIGFLLTAPLTGMYLNKIGHRNAVMIGISVMTLSTLTFGMASYF